MGRTAVVQSVFDVTPNMRRIVFGGPELSDFPAGKEGGYIKIVFPDLPRVKPDRPVMRTYSIRAQDAEKGEIAVDFAMHADTGGIASDWAVGAKPYDAMPINGPATGKMVPPDADWYLIAGDMTVQPAAMCNLEAERFHRSSPTDWFRAFLQKCPTSHMITAMSREIFDADTWKVVGRKVSKDRLP